MSEVKRYDIEGKFESQNGEGIVLINPKMVLEEDYNAAQSELAALREELAKVSREKNDVAYRANETAERLNSMTISKATMRNKLKQRLTAAEQRNEELVELLDSAFFRLDTFIEADREMPIPSMEVLRDAILRHCPTLKPTESGASE